MLKMGEPALGTAVTAMPTAHGQSSVITCPAVIDPNANVTTVFAAVLPEVAARSLITRLPAEPGAMTMILHRRPGVALMTAAAVMLSVDDAPPLDTRRLPPGPNVAPLTPTRRFLLASV